VEQAGGAAAGGRGSSTPGVSGPWPGREARRRPQQATGPSGMQSASCAAAGQRGSSSRNGPLRVPHEGEQTGKQGVCVWIAPSPALAPDQDQSTESQPDPQPTRDVDWLHWGRGRFLGFSVPLQATCKRSRTDPAKRGEVEDRRQTAGKAGQATEPLFQVTGLARAGDCHGSSVGGPDGGSAEALQGTSASGPRVLVPELLEPVPWQDTNRRS